jgi:hypothetical protein
LLLFSTAESHFGGFLTRSDIEFAEGKSNSRKDWIDTMIADSKKRKAGQLTTTKQNPAVCRIGHLSE